MKNSGQFPKTKVIGLTGPMASGKNLAASILESFGCVSVDADLLVHQAVEMAKPQILETFGEKAKEMKIEILDEQGKINRRELAKIVFLSEENLKKQEGIVHPIVEKLTLDFIGENSDKVVIVNATVLHKIPLVKNCDALIFITAPALKRLIRAKNRDHLETKQILQRFHSQKHLFAKYKKLNSDIYRVMNFGSKTKLERSLSKVFKEIISL
ncbi:MAG: dephospho-CoA kinase [Treponemataceae bacterium]|nr:dephospho-CoA kinase [Treponemataceae bacterium]